MSKPAGLPVTSRRAVAALAAVAAGAIALAFTLAPSDGNSTMTAEPVHFSPGAQFSQLRDAPLIVAAQITAMHVSERRIPSAARERQGVTRDVSTTLAVRGVLRGEMAPGPLPWAYVLHFGLRPTLEQGDVGLFFLHRSGGGEPDAVYLNEDSVVVLGEAAFASVVAGTAALLLSQSHEGDGSVAHHWLTDGPPDDARSALQQTVDLIDAGNSLSVFSRSEGSWRLVETRYLEPRWPY